MLGRLTSLLIQLMSLTIFTLGTLACHDGILDFGEPPLEFRLDSCTRELAEGTSRHACLTNPQNLFPIRGCLALQGSFIEVGFEADGTLILSADARAIAEAHMRTWGTEPISASIITLLDDESVTCAAQNAQAFCQADLGCIGKGDFILSLIDQRVEIIAQEGEELCRWSYGGTQPIEQCDGVDNDCDEIIDEGFAIGTECHSEQLGNCRRTGVIVCDEQGQSQCMLTQVEVEPTEELCDGLDHDCDGAIDESFPEQNLSCVPRLSTDFASVNASFLCRDGILICPIEERCDGEDNDVDGQIDEGFSIGEVCTPIDRVCYSSVGHFQCMTQEILQLGLGELGEVICLPDLITLGLEGSEGCDGIDDDCDGFVDEDYIERSFSCGVGACENTQGLRFCNQGEVMEMCEPLMNTATDDNCDGIDDDCDGLVDESFTSYQATCENLLGACSRQRMVFCINHQLQQSCPEVSPPSLEDLNCDGIDEDCDGFIDEDYVPRLTSCGLGVCQAQSLSQCVDGVEDTPCTSSMPVDLDENCNGVDDDCDGFVDEAYVPYTYNCFLGECLQVFTSRCFVDENGSEEQNSCPLEGVIQPRSDHQCDGLDNDCDGQVDEAYLVEEVSCGEGECLQFASVTCQNGTLVNHCIPEAPVAGVIDDCDGIDNDCDGKIDEAFIFEEVTCGECDESGLTTCIHGVLGNSCSAVIMVDHPEDECDGIDQDCDGKVDEGYVATVTNCGVGLCASTGTSFCSFGVEGDSCLVGVPTADVNCDGFDQDCDGGVDEGYQISAILCGQGECLRGGLRYCLNAEVIYDCTPAEPTIDENCNGKDEDCDGFVDEGYDVVSITCGVGVCEQTGFRVCTATGVQNNCTVGLPLGLDDDCDGLDDDCDGSIDEGFVGQVLTCGFGPCEVVTRASCVNGTIESVCEPLPPTSSIDSECNQIDEDCDGHLDENYVRIEESCGPGSCEDTALTICTQTGVVSTCSYQSSPVDQTCNGVDEDCDGLIDENYLPPATQETCGQGVCLAQAEIRCIGGSAEVVCQPGDSSGEDHYCNELDDDCDGSIDESFTQTLTCGLGLCERTVVVGCSEACVPYAPGVELCGDELDNDCDGSIDEGFEHLNEVCTVGVGVCMNEGILKCQPQDLTAPLTCSVVPGLPQDELCDRLDNDCDGSIDEGNLSNTSCVIPNLIGTACYQGMTQCVAGILRCQSLIQVGEREENYCTALDEDCDSATIAQVSSDVISENIPYQGSFYSIQLGQICGANNLRTCDWTCVNGNNLLCYRAKSNEICMPNLAITP